MHQQHVELATKHAAKLQAFATQRNQLANDFSSLAQTAVLPEAQFPPTPDTARCQDIIAGFQCSLAHDSARLRALQAGNALDAAERLAADAAPSPDYDFVAERHRNRQLQRTATQLLTGADERPTRLARQRSSDSANSAQADVLRVHHSDEAVQQPSARQRFRSASQVGAAASRLRSSYNGDAQWSPGGHKRLPKTRGVHDAVPGTARSVRTARSNGAMLAAHDDEALPQDNSDDSWQARMAEAGLGPRRASVAASVHSTRAQRRTQDDLPHEDSLHTEVQNLTKLVQSMMQTGPDAQRFQQYRQQQQQQQPWPAAGAAADQSALVQASPADPELSRLEADIEKQKRRMQARMCMLAIHIVLTAVDSARTA